MVKLHVTSMWSKTLYCTIAIDWFSSCFKRQNKEGAFRVAYPVPTKEHISLSKGRFSRRVVRRHPRKQTNKKVETYVGSTCIAVSAHLSTRDRSFCRGRSCPSARKSGSVATKDPGSSGPHYPWIVPRDPLPGRAWCSCRSSSTERASSPFAPP